MELGDLSGNRLSNVGISALVESLGPSTQAIDLAENAFDHRGAEVVADFVRRGAPQLQYLDLSRNHLNDAAVAVLCKELLACPGLLRLGLADVQLGAGSLSGPALGAFVEASNRLQYLDLSFNMLQGEGAYQLLAGVYGNGLGGGVLRTLNLSWNCLGQGRGHERVTGVLGSVLHDCSVLFHLDLSFNQLDASACSTLADALHENHTLWGLHLDGNSAIVDPDGFVRVLADEASAATERAASAARSVAKVQRKPKGTSRGKARARGQKPTAKPGAGADSDIQAKLSYILERSQMVGALREHQRRAAAEEAEQVSKSLKAEFIGGCLRLLEPLSGYEARPLSPRSQAKWLQVLSYEIRPELRGALYRDWHEEGSLGARIASPKRGKAGAAVQRPCLHGDRGPSQPQAVRSTACWVCEGWVEVTFSLTPGVSTETDLTSASCVRAFVSVDNFARPVTLRKAGHRWEGVRFLPPTQAPLLVVFQVGSQLEVAQDMPRQRLMRPLRVPLQDSGGGGSVAEHPDSQTHDAPASSLGHAGAVTRTEVREIEEVNLFCPGAVAEAKLSMGSRSVAQRHAGELPEHLDRARLRPRLLDPLDSQVLGSSFVVWQAQQHWPRASSVWAAHPSLLDDVFEAECSRSLEFDWALARFKLNKKCSASELEEARRVLQDHAVPLWCLYQHLCSVARQDKPGFGVGLGPFMRLVEESGLARAHPGLGPGSVDCVFLACRSVPGALALEATVLCPDGLVRWQFLEAVLRLGELCRAPEESLGQAVARLYRRHLRPLAEQLSEEVCVFRAALLTETLDEVFRSSLQQLQEVYGFFANSQHWAGSQQVARRLKRAAAPAGRRQGLDNPNTMAPHEWLAFVQELGLLEEAFPERMALKAFAMGAPVNAEEASSSRHLEMRFAEFLQALGWALFQQAGGRQTGASRLAVQAQRLFEGPLRALHRSVCAWQGSPLPGREELLQHWSVGTPWMHRMWSLLQELFKAADDDGDGSLSPREFRLALANPRVQRRLAALGVEVAHISSFFAAADRDKSGHLSPAEALHGFARVKEQLQGDERALRFLRETLGEPSRGEAGELYYDSAQPVTRAAVEAAAASSATAAKMQLMHLDFDLKDLWEFLESERAPVGGSGGGTTSFTLEAVLCGYLAFRDPRRHAGDKAVTFLEHLFRSGDLDGSGTLEHDEFLALMRDATTREAMQAMGLSLDESGEGRIHPSLQMLFQRIDQDASGSLSIDEVLHWFLELREMVRQRELEERFAQ